MGKSRLSTVRHLFLLLLSAWNFLLAVLFPPRCLSCKKEGSPFCADCRAKLPEHTTIGARGVITLWNYGDKNVREALWQLKFFGKKTLARELSDSLYDKLLEAVSEDAQYWNPLGKAENYLIIPVPLSKERLKMRGYNQSALLAKELAVLNEDLFVFEGKALVKTKETGSQVSVKNREKRLKNLRGAFAVAYPETVRGKNIILIDDIVTTGATLGEARRVLLKAGAKRVLAATIAH